MDKRVGKRRIKRLPINFSDGEQDYNGTSSNFSSNGLFIRTRRAFVPGTSVKMVLEVEEERKILLMGVVVRAIKTGLRDFKNGMGIKLTSLSQDYKDFLKELSAR